MELQFAQSGRAKAALCLFSPACRGPNSAAAGKVSSRSFSPVYFSRLIMFVYWEYDSGNARLISGEMMAA